MFRKFHGSMLLKGGMTESEIDSLHGRGKSPTHAAYFYDDTKDLHEKYISCLHLLAIRDNVNIYDMKSPEYIQLENELIEKNAEVESYSLVNIDNSLFDKALELNKISKQFSLNIYYIFSISFLFIFIFIFYCYL